MLTEGNFIEYEQSRLYYVKTGVGPLPLLLFHGFGQDHTVFNELGDPLKKEYTLYSFDLYFHGSSEWNSDKPLEKADLKEILNIFFTREKINKFAVAGYSMGGKFALATIESHPDKVEKIFLLAPDGVKTNFWYRLATGNPLARGLFHSMIQRPKRFQDIVKMLGTAGLVPNGVLRFAQSQMDTKEKRSRVYNAWMVFRHLKFDMRTIAHLLNKRKIPVTTLVGRFDKMIPVEAMNVLTDKLILKEVEILKVGHNDIIQNSVDFFLSHKKGSNG